MTGRDLYHRWCGSSTSDAARYFDLMNPADRDRWDQLADGFNAMEDALRDIAAGRHGYQRPAGTIAREALDAAYELTAERTRGAST